MCDHRPKNFYKVYHGNAFLEIVLQQKGTFHPWTDVHWLKEYYYIVFNKNCILIDTVCVSQTYNYSR